MTSTSAASAMRVAGGAGLDVSGIGRRAARRLVGPGFEVVDSVDDTPAELAESRAATVAAVFLQRPWRNAEDARGLVSAHVARSELRGPVEHGKPPSCLEAPRPSRGMSGSRWRRVQALGVDEDFYRGVSPRSQQGEHLRHRWGSGVDGRRDLGGWVGSIGRKSNRSGCSRDNWSAGLPIGVAEMGVQSRLAAAPSRRCAGSFIQAADSHRSEGKPTSANISKQTAENLSPIAEPKYRAEPWMTCPRTRLRPGSPPPV